MNKFETSASNRAYDKYHLNHKTETMGHQKLTPAQQDEKLAQDMTVLEMFADLGDYLNPDNIFLHDIPDENFTTHVERVRELAVFSATTLTKTHFDVTTSLAATQALLATQDSPRGRINKLLEVIADISTRAQAAANAGASTPAAIHLLSGVIVNLAPLLLGEIEQLVLEKKTV